jgi:hypothetical protein
MVVGVGGLGCVGQGWAMVARDGWVDVRRLEAGRTPMKRIYTTEITPRHPYTPPKPQSNNVIFSFLVVFGD